MKCDVKVDSSRITVQLLIKCSVSLQKLQTIAEDFCGLDVNTPLGGEDAVEGTPVITFETHLTAVVATSTGDYTVVFVGTKGGHLKKVSARYSFIYSIEESAMRRARTVPPVSLGQPCTLVIPLLVIFQYRLIPARGDTRLLFRGLWPFVPDDARSFHTVRVTSVSFLSCIIPLQQNYNLTREFRLQRICYLSSFANRK